MIDKNVVVLQEEMQESYKPKLAAIYSFHSQYNSMRVCQSDILKNAQNKERYFKLFAECTDKNAITVKKLVEKASSSAGW
jgi:primosomal protein N' (replication factor Y)